MTKTVISGTSGFCTPQQFIDRYDVRTIGRLLSDDGTTVLNTAQVLASTVLNSLLMANSGIVEAACLRGGKYAVADLQALQSPTMTNGGHLLASLVAKMTMWDVWSRRPRNEREPAPDYQEAQGLLDSLGMGDRIFGFQETADAGHLLHQRMTADDIKTRGGPEVILERYFGRRGDRDRRNVNP